MAHRLASRAAADLEEIWIYVERESGSADIANRLIDSITDRFLLLASHPCAGRARNDDLGPAGGASPWGSM